MPALLLQLAQQVEDLRLRRHVERRRRLVGDEQARIARERHRDHRPLAQAAAQLERVLVDAPLGLGDADAAQHLDAAAPRLLVARPSLCSMHRLDDLVADRVHGAERGHRLLEDQADLAAADRAHLAAVGVELGEVESSLPSVRA